MNTVVGVTNLDHTLTGVDDTALNGGVGLGDAVGEVISSDGGHFEMIIYLITFFLFPMSLILVSFIMTVLFLNDFGILKTLGVCAVLLVVLVPIAIQVMCTSNSPGFVNI